MEAIGIERILEAVINSENGNILIFYINNISERIIFCESKWSLIDGIFSDEYWEYEEIDIKKYDLKLSLAELVEKYPKYSFNSLKIK